MKDGVKILLGYFASVIVILPVMSYLIAALRRRQAHHPRNEDEGGFIVCLSVIWPFALGLLLVFEISERASFRFVARIGHRIDDFLLRRGKRDEEDEES